MIHIRQQLPIVLLLVLIGAYTYQVLSGGVSFTLWGQVSYVHEHGGLSLQDAYSHPHTIRYLLVYPVYALQVGLENIALDLLFSLYLELTLIVTAVLISYAVSLHVKPSEGLYVWLLLSVLLVLFVLSYLMNGRLLIAFLAVACLVVFCGAIMQPDKQVLLSYFTLVGALLFGNVTSGVFLAISSALFLVFVCRYANRSAFKGRWLPREALFALTGLLFVPVAYLLFFKNVDYFAAQDVEMLDHGLNLMDKTYWKLNLIWIAGLLIACWYLVQNGIKHVISSEKIYLPIAYAVFLLLSVYAYSIVAVSVIFAITLGFILVLNRYQRQFYG